MKKLNRSLKLPKQTKKKSAVIFPNKLNIFIPPWLEQVKLQKHLRVKKKNKKTDVNTDSTSTPIITKFKRKNKQEQTQIIDTTG